MGPGGAPLLEFSAGYAFLSDGELDLPLGWSVSVARNMRPWLGIVGDVGGNYTSEEGVVYNIHSFLGGARVTLRFSQFAPYFEILAGAARGSAAFEGASIPGTSTGHRTDLAVQTGLGVHLTVREGLAVRAGFDFRSVARDEQTFGQLRFTAGVVFRSQRAVERPAISPPPPVQPTPPVEPTPPEPVAPPPEPVTPAPEPPSRYALGHEMMIRGNYFEAASAFLDYVRLHASDQFTITVGTFCELENVSRQVADSGQSLELFVLPVQFQGRACYRVLWGLFSTREAALQAIATIPVVLRAPRQVPVPISQLIY